MKISVIIPAYNEENYLSKTLEAILAQDYPDFEVIVIDNASTDKTSEIAKSFQGVKVLSETRKGTMWACERGRKEAAGEIIVRMDADCMPEKGWLSKGSVFFINPKVVGVSGPYDYFDHTAFFRRLSFYFQKWTHGLTNVTAQFFGKGAVMIGGNSFMRASALNAIGGFNTRLTFYGDDADTAKRLAQVGKVLFEPSLVMRTSARRFKKEGVVRLEFKYLFNFFKIIFSSDRKS